MANLNLGQTGETDILTTFRFELHIDASANPIIGLDQDVVGYIISCDLPSAPGEPLVWNLPGGMKNFQAGKRTVQAINTTFVIDSNPNKPSILKMLEKWTHATYDLNTGTNRGKANYCTDAISIWTKGEDDNVKYTFRLKRAQVTSCNYGSLSSESNDLIKVSASFIYDNFEVRAGQNGNLLRTM